MRLRPRAKSGVGARRDVEAALAGPVALAFEHDQGGVVDEPVDEGGGDHGVAEGLAPLVEAVVLQTPVTSAPAAGFHTRVESPWAGASCMLRPAKPQRRDMKVG